MWVRASQEASTFKGLEASWLDPCLETMFSKTWNCNFLEKNTSFDAVSPSHMQSILPPRPAGSHSSPSRCSRSAKEKQLYVIFSLSGHWILLDQQRTRKSYYRFRSFRRSARDVFPKLAAQVRHLDQIGIRGWLGEVTESKSKPTPISPDFDDSELAQLSWGCFGMKDTRASGTEVDGRVVRAHHSKPSLWCQVSKVQVGDLQAN